MLKKILFFIFIWYSLSFFGQTRDTLALKNGIDKPSMVTNYLFGIFSIYVKPDFYLNNSPDIQIGAQLQIPISN